MLTRRLQRIILRYGLAVVSTAVAMLFTRFLRGIGDSGVSPLLFGAVLLSAWYGGLGPGLTATVLGSAGEAYLLLRGHAITFEAMRDHLMRVIIFGVVSVLASSLQDALKRAADASRRAKEAAEAASEAKSRFLAMVSHELRTPLSPVLMIADLLQRNQTLSPRVREDINCIRKNVDLEIRLIDDLVDLTRISTGKMHLREEIVRINEPLDAAIAVCREDIREKQLDFTVSANAAELQVKGDPVRLQQVFWNLIRNAIKFTPERGRITVTTRNRPAGFITIEISDTGIGIDPQRLSRIFEAFEQGGLDIQARFGGLGLGLAICQALVEAHHGTIKAASEGRTRGATFTVEFPVVAQRVIELPLPAAADRNGLSDLPGSAECQPGQF
jgi:signal transduction histidine kinase